MYSRSLEFQYPIWNTFVRIKLFILPSLWHNDNISVKKNMVWQNTIYSITNQGIDLEIPRHINWSMAHIFVTVSFSGKCLLMGATFDFLRKVRSGPSR
jgi:hypothetical protein